MAIKEKKVTITIANTSFFSLNNKKNDQKV